jgi:putative transposase
MLTGRRYLLQPTLEQEEVLERWAGICRSVWNTGLEQRQIWSRRGKWISAFDQMHEVAEAKVDEPWLRDPPSMVLQQLIRDLEKACRKHGAFRIRWRKKDEWHPSFRWTWVQVERLNRKWGRAKLAKIGWLKFRWSQPLNGQVKNATILRRGDRWYLSLMIDDGLTTPDQHAHPGTTVGVDRGVTLLAATSDGEKLNRSYASPRERERYRRLEKKLSRQKRGSANRRKTKLAMGRWHERVKSRRRDFTAKIGRDLATRYELVALEDLKTSNMTRSARGTIESPGKNVRQKAGLNRAILDKGWGSLEMRIRSSARYTGSRVVKINPAYTSQTCSRCRCVDRESRESQAKFRCRHCGFHEHADVNAAINIRTAGLAVSACGDLAEIERSAKQEPATMNRKLRKVEVTAGLGL